MTAAGSGAPADDSGAAADDSGAPPGPEPDGPAPRHPGRRLWSWARRRPLIVAITVCVLEAAAVAGTGLATLPSPPPGPRFASLPAQPCAMVSPADVAKITPGATGSPLSIPGANHVTIGTCKWSARSGGQDKTLITQTDVFGTLSGVDAAQQSYRATLASLRCRCPGVTVSARPVPGLGDEATEVYVAPRADADFARSPNAAYPGITLLVRSSNALIGLVLDATAPGTGAFLAAPPSAGQRAGLMSVARDILGDLARPASARLPAAAPVAPEAHYAGRPDPCRLISEATLARYAPDVVLSPGGAPSSGSTQDSECDWNSDSTSITVRLGLYPGTSHALRDFDSDAQTVGVTVSGARWIPDLAEAAAGTFTFDSGSDTADLFLWSGNVYLDFSLTDTRPARLDHSAPLAGVIAMARDGLAALARPALSAYGQGPRYASPHDACTMVRSSTLARYAPGVTVNPFPGNGKPDTTDESNCGLGSDSVSVFLNITIDSDADTAQSSFEFDVQYAQKNHGDTKFRGMRPVHGVGEQATAIFQIFARSPVVDLFVWSGNAEVEVSSTDLGLAPPLSRAGKLAADIAIARDVLATLPAPRPNHPG